MHEAENAQDRNNWGVGPSWLELATATAEKETADAAKITQIIWGAIAKTTGDPRAAPFVD